MEWLASAGLAFVAIAPVELPDKTFVATLVLATRYRPLPVWLGVATAFALHVAVAATAGSLVALLPAVPVRLAAAGLFAAGAVVLFRAARRAGVADIQEQEQEYADHAPDRRGSWAAYGASFALLFAAEWGDLSQLLTVSLVARGEDPVGVFTGAWVALAAVSGTAVLLGSWLVRRVRLSLVRYVGAGVCAVLAVLTLVSAFSLPG